MLNCAVCGGPAPFATRRVIQNALVCGESCTTRLYAVMQIEAHIAELRRKLVTPDGPVSPLPESSPEDL